MRLIAVVLGADTGSERFDIASEMLDYGFAHYRLYPVAQEGTKVRGELPVTGGDSAGVPLVLGGALTLLIQKGEEQGIQLVPDLPESVEAPIARRAGGRRRGGGGRWPLRGAHSRACRAGSDRQGPQKCPFKGAARVGTVKERPALLRRAFCDTMAGKGGVAA